MPVETFKYHSIRTPFGIYGLGTLKMMVIGTYIKLLTSQKRGYNVMHKLLHHD